MKVDVSAVMADIWHRGFAGDNVLAFESARDAIAELIAADEEYDEILGRLHLLMLADPRRDVLEKQLKASRARRTAALLACKGQDHER